MGKRKNGTSVAAEALEQNDAGTGAETSSKVRLSKPKMRKSAEATASIQTSEGKNMLVNRCDSNKPGRTAAKEQEDPCSSSKGGTPKNNADKEDEMEVRRKRKRMRGRPPSALASATGGDAAVARIKKQVKYFFNCMKLEQNLIDAYSHDGWKGQSREKVRPEKELQRATAKILKFKLKIRQAMQELDAMCLEGSIMDSAFDADGQLDSEEIFCARCHSHDAEVDNDIILCDGACNRGFHQKCLDPPLATEDIPPGDEGWICPVCDCKSDCVNFLNDHLGTDFEVETSWEYFFPEAVEGSNMNEGGAQDLPSDESDDDDYDPEAKETDNEKPAELDTNGQVEKEEPGSENSSESNDGSEEDGSDSDNDSTDLSDEDHLSGGEEHDENQRDTRGDGDEAASNDCEGDELASLQSGKRKRKEVDYRKLHDEMFGIMGDEWEDGVQSEDEDYGPMKRGRKRNAPAVKDVSAHSDGIDDKSKRIPAEAVQRLRRAFEENQLPSRSFKEDLSKELGLSYRKVDVWFKNFRTQALKKGLAQPTRPCPWKSKAKDEEANQTTLLTQLGEVQMKLHDMRKTMEAVKQPEVLKLSPHIIGFDNTVIDVKRGKRVIYKPVGAEVVEKSRDLQQVESTTQ